MLEICFVHTSILLWWQKWEYFCTESTLEHLGFHLWVCTHPHIFLHKNTVCPPFPCDSHGAHSSNQGWKMVFLFCSWELTMQKAMVPAFHTILYRGLEHLRILYKSLGTNAPGIWRGNCISSRGVKVTCGILAAWWSASLTSVLSSVSCTSYRAQDPENNWRLVFTLL